MNSVKYQSIREVVRQTINPVEMIREGRTNYFTAFESDDLKLLRMFGDSPSKRNYKTKRGLN